MVFTHNMGFWPLRYAAIVVVAAALVVADSSLVLGQDGKVALSMNTEGMFRGQIDATGKRKVAIYSDE